MAQQETGTAAWESSESQGNQEPCNINRWLAYEAVGREIESEFAPKLEALSARLKEALAGNAEALGTLREYEMLWWGQHVEVINFLVRFVPHLPPALPDYETMLERALAAVGVREETEALAA